MGLKHDLYVSRRPLAGYLVIGIAWSCYFAQMPVIKGNVGASDSIYGWAVFLAGLGALAASWAAPRVADVARGAAMPLACVCVAAGLICAGAAHGLAGLVTGVLLISAGTGVIDVLVNGKISELEGSHPRPLMNLNHACYSFAYAGAAFATGLARTAEVGPLALGCAVGVVILTLAWVTRGMIVDVHADDPADPAGVPMGVIWIGGLVVMVAFLAESAAEGWSALHIERTLEGSPAQGAFGPAMLGLMMGVGRLSGHLVSGAMSDTRMMQVASGMCAAGLALAAVAPSVPVALAGFALAGLGISVVGPLALALIGRLVPRSARLYAISRASVLGHVAFLIGPVLMGVVSQGFGLRVAFGVIVVVLVAVVAGLIPRLARAGGR